MARPSGSVPFLAARLSGQWPLAMADSSKLFPASQTTLPERESKMVQPRVPPFQSPSLAVATRWLSTQPIESGSRRTSVIAPVGLMTPSLAVSMPLTLAVPALNEETTRREAMPMIAMWVVLLQGDGDAASVGGDLHVLGLRIALHRFPPENSRTATCGLGPPHLGGAGVMGGGDRVNRS